jgi:cytochrome c-type biogenesis protein CcmH
MFELSLGLLALVFIALAWILIALPRAEHTKRPVLLLLVAVPVLSFALYAWQGSIELGGKPPMMPAPADDLVSQLEIKLQKDPDNLEGWLILSRSYQALNQPDKAQQARGQVLRIARDLLGKLTADDPDRSKLEVIIAEYE